MKLRIASWNVNSRSDPSEHAVFLKRHSVDIVMLQETRAKFHTQLVALGLFDWHCSSLDLAKVDGPGRHLGCSIFGKAPLKLIEPSVLDTAPMPERTLISSLGSPVGEIAACSFHIPPGASWGEIKPRTFRAIAAWLKGQRQRVFFGMDANAPEYDRFNHHLNIWWWPEEELVLGAAPPHTLRDAYRVYLGQEPAVAAAIRVERPDGPLATSYRIPNSHRTVRYDFIYTTPDIRVEHVEYLYDEVRAASDHALVVADCVIE